MMIVMVSPYPPQPDGIGAHARNLVDAIGDKAAVFILAPEIASRDGKR